MASSTSFSWCCESRAKKNAQADAVQLKPRFCSATEAKDTGKFRPFEDSDYFNVQEICRPRFHGAPPEEQKRLLLGSLKTVGIEFPLKSTPHAEPGKETKRQDALQKVQKQMDGPGLLAMLMWTMDKRLNLPQVYKKVNEAIMCDDGDQLTHLGDYIAALNYYIDNDHVTEEVTLYTGTSIKKHQQVLCEAVDWKSHFFRQPKFLCATKDEEVADRFCEDSESPVKQLVVPAGCKFCAPVPSGLSAYPEEGEYLLAPFVAMQLVGQKKRQFPAGSGRERLVVTYNVVEGCAPAAAGPSFSGDRTLPEGIPSCLMKKFRGAYIRAEGEGRDTAAPLKAVALVIGIQDYARGKGLHNTLNDADDMKDKLESLGFKVTIVTDKTVDGGKVSQHLMLAAIRNFVKEVDEHTVAFFCFYGHGAEKKGVHYLVPHEMPEADALVDEAVALKMGVLSRINDKRPLVTV
eukprot:COSAG01_NODE_12215_length_1778_cov_2.245384_1_plen_460_part_10